MKSTTARILLCAMVGLGIASANEAQAAAVFMDTFESGTAGVAVGAPWGKNDISVMLYQSAGNPFPNGSIYADLLDPGTGTAPSQALRLMSHRNLIVGDPVPANPLIAGQVTTFSYNFWEPIRTGDVNSLVTGYYREQANVDLNTGGRNYTATLREGNLSPQGTLLGGAATTYPLETVNTLFMFANDSGAAVVNYAGTGLTLAATSADVWLAIGNAAPVYAFSVDKQNDGVSPVYGVGYRTNNADVERFFIDNVLVESIATFDRSALVPEPTSLVLLSTITCAAFGMARRGRREAAR